MKTGTKNSTLGLSVNRAAKKFRDKKVFSFFLMLMLCGLPLSSHSKPAKTRFEGNWQSCFIVGGDTAAKGSRVCTGYQLVQKDKKICGTWTQFASTLHQGQLQAIQVNSNKARWIKSCTLTDNGCLSQGENSYSTSDGSTVNKEFRLCHGRLMDAQIPCTLKNAQSDGYKRANFPKKDKQALKSEPWIKSCFLE